MLVAAERDAEPLETVISDDDDVAIAEITAAELLLGVELATGRRRAVRAAFVDGILAAVAIQEYGLREAYAHAKLMGWVRASGTPRGAHDLLIAATALGSHRTLVTLDAGFTDLPGLDVRFVGR